MVQATFLTDKRFYLVHAVASLNLPRFIGYSIKREEVKISAQSLNMAIPSPHCGRRPG
jgi:hypothetical protein